MSNTTQTDSLSKPPLTPEIWLEKNIKFRVPVYQRLFTWDKPQFERLLSDLNDWKEGPYYLGIITVVEMNGSYVLIDGQQRLTVIAILMGMFKNELETLNLGKRDVTGLLDYEARPNDRLALKEIWDYWNNWCEMDQETFDKILSTSKIASDSMRSFIRYIYEKKCEWHMLIKNKELFKKLKLLISCLPKNYDIKLQNEYFEKMNSAGKQLEPHEILKVRICTSDCDFENWNRIEDFSEKFKFFKKEDDSNPENNQKAGPTTNDDNGLSIMNILMGKYDNYKTALETKFKNKTESTRTTIEKWRPSLIDFPMFLLHALKFFSTVNGNDAFLLPPDSHTLLEKFEKNTSNTFVCCMSDYRMFLDEWIIHKEMDSHEQSDPSEDNSTYSYWSRNKDNTEIKIIACDTLSTQTLRELKQIQMALYALGGQKQEWMIDAYSHYKSSSFPMQSQSIEESLLNLLNFHVRQLVQQLANDEKMKSDFKMLFEKDCWPDECLTYNHNSRALFVCLDYFLWLLANSNSGKDDLYERIYKDVEDKDKAAITHFIPKPNKSVEHFHPQTDDNSPTKDQWSASLNLDQTIKDMFGNLALISAGKNSEYGNQPIPSKSERIKMLVRDNKLESIKLYLMMKECQEKDINWNRECACLHAKKMLEVLKWGLNYYNIPSSFIWESKKHLQSDPIRLVSQL